MQIAHMWLPAMGTEKSLIKQDSWTLSSPAAVPLFLLFELSPFKMQMHIVLNLYGFKIQEDSKNCHVHVQDVQ